MKSVDLEYLFEIRNKCTNEFSLSTDVGFTNDIRTIELAKKYADFLLGSTNGEVNRETANKCFFAGEVCRVILNATGDIYDKTFSDLYKSITEDDVYSYVKDSGRKEKDCNNEIVNYCQSLGISANKEYREACLTCIFLFGIAGINPEEVKRNTVSNPSPDTREETVYYKDRNGRIRCNRNECEYRNDCNTDCPIWMENQIRPLVERKKYEEAIIAYIDYTEKVPEYAEGWNNLGISFLHNGEYSNGYNSIKKAFDLEPDNPKYILSLAEAADKCQKFDECIKLCDLYDSISGDDGSRKLREHVKAEKDPDLHFNYCEDESEYYNFIRKLDKLIKQNNKKDFFDEIIRYALDNYQLNPGDVFNLYRKYLSVFRSNHEAYELRILDLFISDGTAYGYGKEALAIKKQYYTKKLLSNEWHRK